MKISVVIPTYGCPPELFEKCLLSVASQTYTDFEIIIKDGNVKSPVIEDSRIASLFKSLSPKIKYILSPDGHPSEAGSFYGHNGFYPALNDCVLASTGEIITLLASDDERGPDDTLAYVHEQFEKHGSSPFCLYGQCEWVDRSNSYLETKIPEPIPVTHDSMIWGYNLYTPAIFWNREVHRQFGMFDAETCPWNADLDFWLRCWNKIDSEYAPKILGRYRVWEVSQCRESRTQQEAEHVMIRARHKIE